MLALPNLKEQWAYLSGKFKDQWVFYFWICICVISIAFAFLGSVVAPFVLDRTQDVSWNVYKAIWGVKAERPQLQLWHYWEFAAFFSTFAFNFLFFYVGWFYGKNILPNVKDASGQPVFMRGKFTFRYESQRQLVWVFLFFLIAFIALLLATMVSVVDGACWLQVLCVLAVTYCFLKIDRIMVLHAESPKIISDFQSSVRLNDQPAVLAFCVLLAFVYFRFPPVGDSQNATHFRGFIGGAIAFQMLLSNTVLALIFQEKGETKKHSMKRVTKLLLILVLAAVIAAGWLFWKSWSARSAANSPAKASLLGRPLRVGIVSWPGYAGGIVANNGFKPNEKCIFWNNHKLLVEFVLLEDVDARAKAFAGKSIDIMWSTVDFWAYESPGFLHDGPKARAIMQVDWSHGGDAIVADQSIRRIEDLKGKKISLALFTPSHWLLEYSLQKSDLSPTDQDQIVKGIIGKNASPDARQAFVAEKVDAAVVWEPDVTQALKERKGSRILESTQHYPDIIADIMVAREDFISQHPNVIRAFIAGWFEGTEKAKRNADKVVKLLRKNEPLYESLGTEVTEQGLNTVKWADLSDNAKMFGLDGSEPIFDRIFTQAGQAWVKRRYIEKAAELSQAKDDHFLREIFSGTSSAAPVATPN
jgi:ABC-type nitrate/sulfonate/bicarbonate transport system substrate-binding protein